MYTTRCTAQTL